MEKIKCNECDKWCSTKKYLSHHIKVKHSTTPLARFQCELCPKTFSTNGCMERHVIIFHHGQRPHVCQICKKSYTIQSSLKSHINACHKGIRFTCHICGILLKRKKCLQMHIKTVHSSGATYACSQCDKTFGVDFYLKNHIERMHTKTNKVKIKERSHKCSICCKAYYTKYNLQDHLKVHAPINKTFKCNSCDKVFGSLPGRVRHVNTVHKNLKYKVSCVFCDKPFYGKSELFLHIKGHVQERAHQCEFCQHSFTTADMKNLHMRIHTGEKLFKCQQCGKEFTIKQHLKAHELIHKNFRPYQCVFCEKRFLTKFIYFDHILRKIDERHYRCKICQVGCPSRSSLRVHMVSHRPGTHKCKKCDKVYKRQYSLIKHVRKKH